jgi:excisionase family DNA binding protein
MSNALIRSIIALVSAKWRPYNYEPQAGVYEKLKCPYAHTKGQKKPVWFVREDVFTCITCPKGCTLSRPEGFLVPLPIRYAEKQDAPFQLTPAEMVSRKALLRVDEAAYCLNISERQIYDWIAEGRLRKAKGNPIRVAAEDVAFCMTNFEE